MRKQHELDVYFIDFRINDFDALITGQPKDQPQFPNLSQNVEKVVVRSTWITSKL